MFGKDVEDERGAVDDLDVVTQDFFDIALLAGRKLIVKNDNRSACGNDEVV